MDDNVVALLRHRPPGIRLILLANNPAEARARLNTLVPDAGKLDVLAKQSLRAAWAFIRSQVSLGTHGLYRSRRRGRGKLAIGIWHGEPMKLVGVPIGDPPQPFNFSVVSSEVARSVRALEFGVPRDSVIPVGTPRLELLRGGEGRGSGWKPAGEKWVVWLPTYRQSVRGEIRRDGRPEDGPLPFPGLSQGALTNTLERAGAKLWLRAHPLAAEFATFEEPFRSASDRALEEHGKTLYELLAEADVLITDYSSVWLDFLYVDKPVIGACYDLDEYRLSRPLAWEPYDEWFPGPICRDAEEMLRELELGLQDPATGSDRRARLNRVFAGLPLDGICNAVWSEAIGRAK